MKYLHFVATCLVLMSMLAVLPDSSITAAAVVLAFAVTAASVAVIVGRSGLLGMHAVSSHGPDDETRRRRGSFGRQHRPDEDGRPMPRAPGSVYGPVRVTS